MAAAPDELAVTIVYDNRSSTEGLTADWGFACVVEGLEKTILFDTGADPGILLENMARLGISRHEVDVIVLSHGHDDHTGGLYGFLGVHSDATVYMPDSFSREFKEGARRRGARVIEVGAPTEICGGALLTGPMFGSGFIPEQSLVLTTGGGAALVTGCAHPGIVNIVERAKEVSGRDVLVAFGGFHLLRQSERSIGLVISRLSDLGVRCAGPCHCSGDEAIRMFADAYASGFLRCEAGTVVPVGRLLGSGAAETP